MVKQLIEANIILLSSLILALLSSLETFILRVGFISFDVGQIIVNGDIAQTHTPI